MHEHVNEIYRRLIETHVQFIEILSAMLSKYIILLLPFLNVFKNSLAV